MSKETLFVQAFDDFKDSDNCAPTATSILAVKLWNSDINQYSDRVFCTHFVSEADIKPTLTLKASRKGAFLVTDSRVFNGPLGRSLRLFTRTAHSAHSLHFATLASLTCSVHGLARSLRSLPHGTG